MAIMVSLFTVLFGELAVGHLAALCRCLWYPLGLVREMIPGMSSTTLPIDSLDDMISVVVPVGLCCCYTMWTLTYQMC